MGGRLSPKFAATPVLQRWFFRRRCCRRYRFGYCWCCGWRHCRSWRRRYCGHWRLLFFFDGSGFSDWFWRRLRCCRFLRRRLRDRFPGCDLFYGRFLDNRFLHRCFLRDDFLDRPFLCRRFFRGRLSLRSLLGYSLCRRFGLLCRRGCFLLGCNLADQFFHEFLCRSFGRRLLCRLRFWRNFLRSHWRLPLRNR